MVCGDGPQTIHEDRKRKDWIVHFKWVNELYGVWISQKAVFQKAVFQNISNTYNLAFKSQNWVSSVIQGLLGRQPDMMASLDENCSLYLTILQSKWKKFPRSSTPKRLSPCLSSLIDLVTYLLLLSQENTNSTQISRHLTKTCPHSTCEMKCCLPTQSLFNFSVTDLIKKKMQALDIVSWP